MWLPEGKEREKGKTRRLGLTYTHYYIENNKDLIYGTGNDVPYLAMTYNGKESEKE